MAYLGNCKQFRFGDRVEGEKSEKRGRILLFSWARNERAGQGFHSDPRFHRDPR